MSVVTLAPAAERVLGGAGMLCMQTNVAILAPEHLMAALDA